MPPTIYDNDRAGIISWLVYINGIEVPAQGVSVSYGVWQVPQAAVTLAPDPILHRIGAEDRISVQIFYLDQWQYSPPKYCLLFDGEVVGWGQQSTANGRALQINCNDYVQILSQLFFFLMSSFDDMAIGASGENMGISGATINVAGYGALYPFSLFSQGLADPGNGVGNDTVIKRPIDFAYNIVRALIKAQHPNRAVPATNFFAPWCKRTNFHKRWIALPYFDADPQRPDVPCIFPVLRAVQDEKAVAAVAQMAGHSGGGGSLWNMLREVLQTLMMEITMLPTPAAVRSDYATLLPKGEPGTDAPVFLTNYFVKPSTYYSIPPACNVFFPSQIENYSYQEDYATQPTRMYFNESAVLSALGSNSPGEGGSGAAALMQDALCTGYPEEVDIASRDARYSPGQNGRNLLVYPEEFFKGPVILRQQMPRWFSFLLQAMETPTTSGTGRQDAPSQDSRGVNQPDPGADGTFSATNEARSELSGADDAVYDPSNHSQFLSVFGFSAGALPHGSLPSAEVMQKLKTYRAGRLGAAVPPQRLPLEPASACPGPAQTGAGSFFSSRGGSPGRGIPATHLHAGLDFAAPKGTTVVSTTAGVVSKKGLVGTNPGGNRLEIRDEKGGKHYYMHLDRFANIGTREIAEGDRVDVGTVIGYVGRTGTTATSYGPHLHYEVHDSSGKYSLNYTSRLRALKLGRPVSDGAAEPSPPTTATGGATAQPPSGAANPPAGQPQQGGPAPGTAQVQGGRIVDASTTEIASADTTRNVFKLYAACEYYTNRYATRTGVISTPFNPYPVPGFGCAMFDRRSTALDAVGYLSTVNHTITTSSWSSSFSYTQGRTFQEMFALMQRSAALESARLGQNQNAIEIAVRNRDLPAGEGQANAGTTNTLTSTTQRPVDSTGTPVVDNAGQNPNNTLATYAVPVGAIAMAPAEPIEEIRVLQEFARAEAFYQTLLYRDTGLGADLLTAAQFRESRDTTDDVPVPYATVREIDDAPRVSERADLATLSVQSGEQVARDRARTQTPVSPERLRSSAAFHYPDVIEMETIDGTRIPISIQGIDTTTRTRMLQAIAAVRNRQQTADDLQVLQEATQTDVAALLPSVEGANAEQTASVVSVQTEEQRQALQTFLQNTEIALRTEGAQINVRGDVHLVPRRGAESLFNSFQAAMQYNARPICTLDEYLMFLGEDALPEGETLPQASNLYANVDPKPAKYYKRLRRLRPGPPSVRPSLNITNSDTVSDAAAGTNAAAPTREFPEDAPELRFNSLSDVLEALGQSDPSIIAELDRAGLLGFQLSDSTTTDDLNRVRGAVALGTISANTGAIVTEIVTRVIDAHRNDREVRAYEAQQRQAAARAAAAAGSNGTAGAPAANADTTANGTPPPQTGTYPVAGIPADFPDTRANWDILLEQYAYNVLQRKPPRA